VNEKGNWREKCNLIIVWINIEGDIHDDDDLPLEVVRSTSRDNSTFSHCLTALVGCISFLPLYGMYLKLLYSKVHAHPNFQILERLLTTMSNTKNEPIHSSDLLATLQYSQQAPILLGRQSKSNMAPLSLITSAAGQPEEYAMIERLFFACLQTGDDKSALICLDKLTKFFGRSNERIMGLHGLYEEAIAGDNSALEKCLREYDDILQQNPVNLVCLPPLQF